MCLKPKPLPPIPQDTRQVAQQIYPPEHLLRRLGQDYADVLRDEDFADLYPPTGQPALSPALLALVTVLEAMEHCSDHLATEMVRSRIDWKYALHLPLDYPGFDPSVLCEFRQRLVAHQAQRRVFDAFLRRLKDKGFLNGRTLQRTDSLAIVASVRQLSRLELVRETLLCVPGRPARACGSRLLGQVRIWASAAARAGGQSSACATRRNLSYCPQEHPCGRPAAPVTTRPDQLRHRPHRPRRGAQPPRAGARPDRGQRPAQHRVLRPAAGPASGPAQRGDQPPEGQRRAQRRGVI